MNILFSCAGRRNYLLSYFRETLGGRGKLLATDSSEAAPAMKEADIAIVVPRVHEVGYIDVLMDICSSHNVGILISLNDHELPILAENKDRFSAIGTTVVVSSLEVVELCFDKGETAAFAENIGIKTPKTFDSILSVEKSLSENAVSFPLFVKPRWGTASSGIELVENMEELRLAWDFGQRKISRLGLRSGGEGKSSLLVQQALPGNEYGVDVVNDLQGSYQATFVKRKLGMRSGETDKAITEENPALVAAGERIGKALGHVGNLDCDFFVDKDDIYLLEMNPRFGGGYPFTSEAGADIPAALVAWAEGREPPSSWRNIVVGVMSAKCDRLVRLN